MSGDVFGYARVSTLDQDPALQLDALAAAGCAKVWTDRVTGTRGERPELTRALGAVVYADPSADGWALKPPTVTSAGDRNG